MPLPPTGAPAGCYIEADAGPISDARVDAPITPSDARHSLNPVVAP